MARIALLKQSCKTQGGLEKHTLVLLKALLSKGVEVDLLVQGPCTLDLPKLQQANLKVLSTKRFGSWWSLNSFDAALTSHLKREKYDAVLGLERHRFQTHYRAGSGVHRFFLNERVKEASLFKKCSLLLNPFHKRVLEFEERTFGENGAKRIYTNSHMVAHQINSLYNTSWSRLCVIHNGVQWKEYEETFNQTPFLRKEVCQKLGLDPYERYLGFIGHGFVRKGLDLALKWLSQSRSQFHLLIIGKDKNSDQFKQQAASLGLLSQVHFLGLQENISLAMTIMEKLILPTRYDPFANVTLEALSMGVDVWTSHLNGASEILPVSSADFDLKCDEAWIAAIEKAWIMAPSSFQERKQVRLSVSHLDLEAQSSKLINDLLQTI